MMLRTMTSRPLVLMRSCLTRLMSDSTGQGAKEPPPRAKKKRLRGVDAFGTLSTRQEADSRRLLPDPLGDDGDDDGEGRYLRTISDSARPGRAEFNRRIVSAIADGDLAAALRVLDVDMREAERGPLEGHYRAAIHACGRVGYHAKAFRLYREYADRGLRPNQGVWADLFNSCANSPFPADALERARYLRLRLVGRNVELSQVVYHNMVKAFGRCGDLERAFLLVDEMVEKSVPVDSDTYCHLLQGCLSDKETGFRHALLVVRSMLAPESRRRRKGGARGAALLPAHFHLLLRCAVECGAGDPDFSHDLVLACMTVEEARRHADNLLEAGKDTKLLSGEEPKDKKAGANSLSTEPIPNSPLELVSEEQKDLQGAEDLRGQLVVAPAADGGPRLPNLLDPKPDFRGLAALGPLDDPGSRLALLGGPHGVCAAMRRHGLAPDDRVFDSFLRAAPPTAEAEAALLDLLEEERVRPTAATLINELIRRRAERREFALGREAVGLFPRLGVEPDVVTFGVLAMCCRSRMEMASLLDDMAARGMRPNQEIFGAMVGTACAKRTLGQLTFVLRRMTATGVRPNSRILRNLEKFYTEYRAQVLQLERDPAASVHKMVRRDSEEGFARWRTFREFYPEWLAGTGAETGSRHPWRQFLNESDLARADRDKSVREVLEADEKP